MAAMRSTGVLAVLLAATVSGCAGTQLFSRAADDDDDRALTTQSDRDALDARPTSDEKLLDPQGVDAGGRWKVVPDTIEAESGVAINPVRPVNMDLPVSEHLARAEKSRAEQRLPEARPHLEAIIQQQPAHPHAHHLLAVIADLEGRWGDAEHHYRMALQSDGNNPVIIGDLGYSYMLQGRLPLAEQYLVQAHALDPSHDIVAGNLARLYGRRGDIAAAQRTLADALPPAEVAQTLSQLFPGAPTDAYGAAPQMSMPPAYADQPPMPAVNGNMATLAASSNQMNMVVPIAGARPPEVRSMGGFVPNAYVAASEAAYGQFQSAPVPPTGIAPTAATTNDFAPQPVVMAHAERPWPPAVWPPIAATAGQSTPLPTQSATAPSGPSKSGVVYLMPRRPVSPGPAAPGVNPNSQPSNPAAVPNGPPPSHDPFAPFPSPGSNAREAQYSSGPGSSRIVTWSNLNGQSVPVPPPLPPTGEQLQAAATPGMSAGPTQQYPIAQRSSPGTASGWNGGMYPPPQRELPADRPTLYDYPSQGAPLRTTDPSTSATAPQSGLPLIQSAPPHAGFEIAPAAALPENPLAGYEAERRKYDQQFEQQVNQTYGRSPAGYIQSPTAQMAVPMYEVPTYQTPPYQTATGAGVPLTPNGTPWPGGRETTSMNTGTPPSATTPPPYRPATATTPSYYRAPTQPWDAAYPGPTISPAP